jgi:glycogen synthase
VRVLHLTTEYPPVIYGGLGSAVGGLVAASALAGVDASVLVVGEGLVGGYRVYGYRPTGAFVSRAGVAVYTTPWKGAPAYTLDLIGKLKPDLIHLHVFWLGPIAHYLHQATGIPLVYTVHSLDLAEYEVGQGPLVCLQQRPVQLAAITEATIVTAPSRSELELVAHYCPEVRDRLVVAGHGIDDFPPGRARDASDESTILFSGRFVDRKGIRDLLEAIPLVFRDAPSARFVLAGGARDTTPVEMETSWSTEALQPYRSRVGFTGWLSHDEMASYYASSDVLVVPSWYEPFGMVILEGMTHGLAIAAAAVGGPAEILEHERTGLLFRPHDIEALAAALIRLATDSGLRQRLGRSAYEDVRRHWTWSERIGGYQNAYECAIEEDARA